MCLWLSVQFGFKLHHVDVTTAFLNGDLEQEVYLEQPQDFTVEGGGDLVCRLKKSIYGLKLLEWNPRCTPEGDGFHPVYQ